MMIPRPSYAEMLEQLGNDPRFAAACQAIDLASDVVDHASTAWRQGTGERAAVVSAHTLLQQRIAVADALYIQIAREVDRALVAAEGRQGE